MFNDATKKVKAATAYLLAAAAMLNKADVEMLAVSSKADDKELRELLNAWFEVRNQVASCNFSYTTTIERVEKDLYKKMNNYGRE